MFIQTCIWSCMYKHIGIYQSHLYETLDMESGIVVHIYNPSTQENETGYRIPSQMLKLHSATVS
jgi:hypothetical protein